MSINKNEFCVLHAFICGRVQGVYFRDFTKRHALQLRLTGFVRNRRDGSVEVHAEGSREDLEKLLGLLKQGPPRARVDALTTEWSDATGKYRDFSVTI